MKSVNKEFEPNKFIVINIKHVNELESEGKRNYAEELFDAIKIFTERYYKTTGKEINQKYLVCNQDEPYADEIRSIILGTKDSKLTRLHEENERLRDALKKAQKFIENGAEYGYIRMPDEDSGDTALLTLPAIIEALNAEQGWV